MELLLSNLDLQTRAVFTTGISIYRGQFTEQITAKYWYTHTQSIATQTHSQCMRSHGRDLASHLKAFIRGSRRPHLQRIKNSKWANEYSISSFDEIHNRKWVKA